MINSCHTWLMIVLIGMLMSQSVGAQELDFEIEGESEEAELETDRDSFTPCMTTVGDRILVVESAYSFIENRDRKETHSFPELLLRYGISEWFELRFGYNYEVGGTGELEIDGFEGLEQESTISYGMKAQISEQSGWIPRSIVIAQGFTPTNGEETATQFVATYGFGWELFNFIRWDSSIRYGTLKEEEDRFSEWAPSTILRMPFWERWNAHIEYFAITTDGRENELNEGFVSPGVHCLVTPNLELGVRIGWGGTQDAPNFFANAGFGWRY